ncbi:MAG: FKBP-type peptidyl-prolyl cis-trans isomerase [Balneolaceae bacterium]|nr:FKBP-type peptidyl-prolyl cis-trans isomerase [Balneolaceae bacterium]
MKFAKFLILPLAVMLIQSCSDNATGGRVNFDTAPPPFDTTTAIIDSTAEDGLQIYIYEEGNGPFEVVSNDAVSLYFTGRTTDGTIFDSSYRNGATGPVTLNNLTPVLKPGSFGPISPLIEGFRRGIIGMKEGERRTIVIPPSLGYGESQSGENGFDLRNDTLIFDLELDRIISP